MPGDIEHPQLCLTPLRINVAWHFAAALPPRREALTHIRLHLDIHGKTEKSKGGRTGGWFLL